MGTGRCVSSVATDANRWAYIRRHSGRFRLLRVCVREREREREREMALGVPLASWRLEVGFLIHGSNKVKTKSKTPIPSLKKPQAF